MFNIPNILTLLRILLIPFTGYLICTGKLTAAVALFAISCLTDILDGYIARRFNLVTDLGKLLDPIADKGMQITVFVCMAINGLMPWQVAIIIMCKEAAQIIGGASLYKHHVIMSASWFGKVSTVVTSVCLLIILLFFDFLSKTALVILQWVPAATALFAFIKYLELFLNIRKGNCEK